MDNGYFVRHYGWLVEVAGMVSIVYLTCKGVRWVVERAMSLEEGAYGAAPEDPMDEQAPAYEWKPRYRWYAVTATALSWGAGALMAIHIPLLLPLYLAATVASAFGLADYIRRKR